MSGYLNFDEAVAFLNTTRSTLYKWLRAGKVPGHKLGRQWRFLTEDLQSWRDGHALPPELRSSLTELAGLFNTRRSRAGKDVVMTTQTISLTDISEKLIGDATAAGASDVHVVPDENGYAIRYRAKGHLEQVVQIDASTFEALDQHWRRISIALRGQDRRRFTIHLSNEGEIIVQYQSLQTSRGTRVTLALIRRQRLTFDLSDICPVEPIASALRTWLSRPYGLLICAGGTGSGKTTTMYALLHEAAKQEHRAVFSMEDSVEVELPGVDQVEVDTSDDRQVRQTFESIFRSDLDVLGIGGGYYNDETITERTALSAARTGHLVVLQVHANNPTEAIEKVCQRTAEDIRDVLLGVVWQELIPDSDAQGRTPRYELIHGTLSS